MNLASGSCQSLLRSITSHTDTQALTHTYSARSLQWEKREKGSRNKVGSFGTIERCQLKVPAAHLPEHKELQQTFVSLLIWRPCHGWSAGSWWEKAGREDRTWPAPLQPAASRQPWTQPEAALAGELGWAHTAAQLSGHCSYTARNNQQRGIKTQGVLFM